MTWQLSEERPNARDSLMTFFGMEHQKDFSLEMSMSLPLAYALLRIEGGEFEMPRARREWSRLSWSVIVFLGLAAAVACASHPLSHDHDIGHPPLCTDSSGAVTLGNGKPTLSPDGGTWPLSPKSFFPILSLAAPSAELLPGLQEWPEALSERDTRTSVSPPMFLVILRQ